MKKVIPIVITILFTGYLLFVVAGMFFASLSEPGFSRIITGVFALAILGVIIAMIYTLVERIKEIDKEDDDDLSKY